MASPNIATKIFHTEGDGTFQPIEGGEPIMVHGIAMANTVAGSTNFVFRDGANTQNLFIFRMNSVTNMTFPVRFLAHEGFGVSSALAAGFFVTVFYRPTG